MQFLKPLDNGFTIYSKSGCSFCKKAEHLFEELQLYYKKVNCDEYLLESRAEFLDFIKVTAGKEYKTFPMIFHNGNFVGGYTQALSYCDSISE